MKRITFIILILFLFSGAEAQERKVQNRPYLDQRVFHYGFLFGMQMQDMELNNVGPQTIQNEDGTQSTKNIVCDVDNWNPGFTVGVLGELRLNNYFSLRIVPTMHFGVKHITFHNLTDLTESGQPTEVTQNLKTTYLTMPIDIKYSAERFNNYRPYFMAGISPAINLTGKEQDYIQLKRYDCFLEVGIGCDFYLPFFKLIPELKFCYGLTNCLDGTHANNLTDQTKRLYTNSVNVKDSRCKMIVLTFYFE
jgi:hypothetical protein